MCTWQVSARQTVHKHRHPVPSELSEKMPVLAQWGGTCKVIGEEEEEEEEEGVWFPATILRMVPSDTTATYELTWDDGEEHFFAGCVRPRQ